MDEKLFDELLAGIQWMGAHHRGETQTGQVFEYPEPDVGAIRAATRLSLPEFAYLIGVTPRTLRNWERKCVCPTGPARALLKIVSANPQAAVAALRSSCR
ncbi:helix-turn-helix domain-containing protein [Methylomagnum ishizawai]|uniref:helix-turn-helix domain-containing protein n=1 Tax=Methylomagnum ishizawai TaxID=1760988 RepID=UPI001C32D60C|nr:transcriptional regulator [Methylomagnum ishizawai]BBL73029.1 transcriptional regulator [Methylomagnum ishizawai]